MAKYDEYVVNAVNLFTEYVRGIDPEKMTVTAEQVDEFLVARELLDEPPAPTSKEWAHHINERGKVRAAMNRYAGSKARAEDVRFSETDEQVYQIMYAGKDGWKIELGAKSADMGMVVYFNRIKKSAENKKAVIGRLVTALEASDNEMDILPLLEAQLENFNGFTEDASRLAERALTMHESFSRTISVVRERLEIPESTGTDEN